MWSLLAASRDSRIKAVYIIWRAHQYEIVFTRVPFLFKRRCAR